MTASIIAAIPVRIRHDTASATFIRARFNKQEQGRSLNLRARRPRYLLRYHGALRCTVTMVRLLHVHIFSALPCLCCLFMEVVVLRRSNHYIQDCHDASIFTLMAMHHACLDSKIINQFRKNSKHPTPVQQAYNVRTAACFHHSHVTSWFLVAKDSKRLQISQSLQI